MSQVDLVDQAVVAIGRDRPDDYVLAPTRHAEELADKAPALARLLRSARIETLARQYERLDRDAIAAQNKFKDTVTAANWAVFATASLGACIMVAGILGGDNGGFVIAAFGIATVFSGAFASMWLSRVREGNLLEAWMTSRAHAETARLAYFSALVQAGDEGDSDVPVSLLKLEYFRRYQLDVEINYYGDRGAKHRQSADQTLTIGGYAMLVATVASGVAGLFGTMYTSLTALAGLGVIGTAWAALASTQEGVSQDRRNAERYGRTLASLEILRGRLDEVRAGVLAGSQAVLDEYVAAVQEQLSLEHREWLSGAESTRSAIGKLEEALAASQKAPAPAANKP